MWARIRTLSSGLFRRQRMENDMAEEMESHLAARTEDLIRRGVPAADAARQARLEFGPLPHYHEEAREARGLRWIYEFIGDAGYALRQYRQHPAFTILAVMVLAIGIGANTALFSAIDAVLLRMLPVQHPEQLRHLEWSSRKPDFSTSYSGRTEKGDGGERIGWSVSYPVYEYLRDHNSSYSGITTAGRTERLNVSIDGGPELVDGLKVAGNYFSTLESHALIGRTLLPEDDRAGAISSVAVLSHGYWERRFGSNPGVLGRKLVANGIPNMVVGVMPKGWCGVDPSKCPDVILPMSQRPLVDGSQDMLQKPEFWGFEVIGRLKDGVSDARASAEIELLMRQKILAYHPKNDYDPPRVVMRPAGQGMDDLRRDLKRPLMILGWAVGSVLVIACANIGGLLLSRAAARKREIVTRLALGAGRGRLIRQLTTETLVLSTLGCLAGLALAPLTANSIARLFLTEERPIGVSADLNLRVLAFSAALCVATGLILGLAPALNAARADLVSGLKASNAGVYRSRFRAGKILIAVQVIFALVLTAGSALFVRTLINLKSEPLGFRPENLLTFQLDPTMNGYRGPRAANFHEEVVKRIAALPGVRSASMSRWGILSGSATVDQVNLPGSKPVDIRVHYVAPRFFETMGFPMLDGRDVTFADREQSKPVMIINQTLARIAFSGQNPVGRTLPMDRAVEIIGLAADTKFDALRKAYPPTVYIPFRQDRVFSMTYVIRTDAEPGSLLAAIRNAVQAVDANVPLFEVRTQVEQINRNIKRERVFASLLSGFAVMSLVLACLGIYSTLAYQVTQRTSEIGIRMALGARRSEVVALVMRESVVPVLLGIGVGTGAAIVAGRLVQSMLYGLKPGDPATLVAVGIALLGSALAAAWLPARRASRIAPMEALRYE